MLTFRKMRLIFLICGLVILVSSIYSFFYYYFIYEDIKPSELYEVNGLFESSYFEPVARSEDYVILLKGSDIRYVISDICLGAFKSNDFERSIVPGESLTLLAEKEPRKTILFGGREFHFIYDIKTDERTFLDMQDSVKKYRDNAKFPLMAGIVCFGIFIVDVLILIHQHRHKRTGYMI